MTDSNEPENTQQPGWLTGMADAASDPSSDEAADPAADEPAVTRQMPAVDAPPPDDVEPPAAASEAPEPPAAAEPAAATEPLAEESLSLDPADPDLGTAASGEEPAVTQQMLAVDAPPPPDGLEAPASTSSAVPPPFPNPSEPAAPLAGPNGPPDLPPPPVGPIGPNVAPPLPNPSAPPGPLAGPTGPNGANGSEMPPPIGPIPTSVDPTLGQGPPPPPPSTVEPTVYEAPTMATATSSDSWAPPKGKGGAYRQDEPGEAPTQVEAPVGVPYGPGGAPSGDSFRHRPSAERPAVAGTGGPGGFKTPAFLQGRDPKRVAVIAAPIAVIVLLLVAWGVDTASSSGKVGRNVELAGRSISGVSEDELPDIVAEVAKDMAARKVTITSPSRQAFAGNSGTGRAQTYTTTVGALGVSVDQKATIEAAMDAGGGGSPLTWLGSFFSTREAPVELTVDDAKLNEALKQLEGADRTQPVEPKMQLAGSGFTVVPGKAGVGVDPRKLSEALEDAAREEPTGAIKLTAVREEVEPTFADDQVQALADRANDLTAKGLKLKADGHTSEVPAQTLRGWLSQTAKDGKLDLAFNKEAAEKALPMLLGGVTEKPKNATVTLQNGAPVVVPGENGVTCCGANAGDKVWQALKAKTPEVQLEAKVTEPEFTTEEVKAWGIKQAIGGNRGYRLGSEINGGVAPGFTTYFIKPGEPRNKNIMRIADEVRGAVIPPGGDFSINDYVGQRSYADGYVDAGAIREGRHVQEVGGGISQFSTTTLNAAYFAGLDIVESQAHSEWFSRYPPGREATMGFPHPDLKLHNNTPYGVMIWTSYTPSTITVTFYSTQYARSEQTGKSESMNGVCRVVVTTRTRTYPDGKSEKDNLKATYRPEGKLCNGQPVPGEEEPPHG